MKNINILISLFTVVALVFTSCSLDSPTEKQTVLNLGNTDFSTYVAIGNSLTAGYQSGSLVEKHQEVSYPKLIAEQTGVGAGFEQPIISYPGLTPIMELIALDPLTIGNATGQGAPTNLALARPYNNLGVPGALLADILLTTSSQNSLSPGNAYFDVILRNPTFAADSTILKQALLLSPTFITCWIGNNDILGYATSGGTLPHTPTGTFAALYSQLLTALVASGADIIVGNIPDVTAVPFFTTLPGVVLDPTTNEPVIVNGNMVPLIGVNPTTDLVLLTAKDAMAQGLGIPVSLGGTDQPLPDAVVLDAAEIDTALQVISDFNASINTIAAANDVPVVDFNSFLNDIKANGYSFGGQEFSSDYISGGIFSLDGVHPTDIGYAIIANKWIENINSNFGTTIPMVDFLAKSTSMIKSNVFQSENDIFKNVVNLFNGSSN